MRPAGLICVFISILTVICMGITPISATETPPAWSGSSELSSGQGEAVRLPAGASQSWWSEVQRNIQRAEYQVTWQETTYIKNQGPAWQAPNRAHNLRTYFTPEGIRVIPRNETKPTWEWGLQLSGWGYEERLNLVNSTKPVISGNRVEYIRDQLVEWYVNDEKGLEQGFTIKGSPVSAPSSGSNKLIFDFAVIGSLKGNLQDNDISFTTAPGGVRVIDFGALHATDAKGRQLAAKFDLSTANLRILVDVTDAEYPVVVDPLATSPSWVAEGDQNDANFGASVSSAGDVNNDGYGDVIIGAPIYDSGQTNEGRAYCYLGTKWGLSETAHWMGESNQNSTYFGSSVSTAGDVNGDGYDDVIIGAPGYTKDETDEGAAFVYHGSVDGLSAGNKSVTLSDAHWMTESNQAGATFGGSVSTAGRVNDDVYDDVIVGATGYSNGQTNEGAAFVYHGSGSGLRATHVWMAESNRANADFGGSVSTAGDVNGDGIDDVIVGATGYTNGQTNEGAAYVYHGSSSGLSATHAWMAESNKADAGFGGSVSTAGNVNGDSYDDVIVGATGYSNGQTNEGAAFVFHGSGSGLIATNDWIVESNQANGYFGHSVTTAGDVNNDGFDDVIVGTGVNTAFVYPGSPNGLSSFAWWRAEPDPGNSSVNSMAVSSAGDVNGDGYHDIIIGLPSYDNGETDEGAVFIHYGTGAGLNSMVAWKVDGFQSEDYFGESVSGAGDVNGDGFDDVIVGAGHYDNGQTNEGAAFVYHGSANGLSMTHDWKAESNQAYAAFGVSVSTAGDVNGDEIDDVIIGAFRYEKGEENEGAAFVYYGSRGVGLFPNGHPDNADWMAESNQNCSFCYTYFGLSVSTAGDVNGDGCADVIIGSSDYTNGQPDEGAAFVYYGSQGVGLFPNGHPDNADWKAESNQANADFGGSVSTAGDVNGDGIDDVIIGASHYKEGAAFVFHGSKPSGLGPCKTPPYCSPLDADWMAESNQSGYSYFGNSVSTAGDVNGDGCDDVIIGATSGSGSDSAFVFHGSKPSGLLKGIPGEPSNADWTDQFNGSDWISVSTAGDVNKDGYSDVIVGLPWLDWLAAGGAFVYHGSDTGLSKYPNWAITVYKDWSYFGFSVSAAGDVNGDGCSDVIIGAPDLREDANSKGANGAYVYYGFKDYSNPDVQVTKANALLFTEGDTPPNEEKDAAFRYIHQIYEDDGGWGVAKFWDDESWNMDAYYSHPEHARSFEAEDLVRRGLLYTPDDPDLRDLLLDIYYHRTAAAQILAGDFLSNLEGVQLGLTAFLPTACDETTKVIDMEICILEKALEAHKYALQGGIDAQTAGEGGGYWSLLSDPRLYDIFKTAVPNRGLARAEYWDGSAYSPVGDSTDPDYKNPLFEKYKDAVLIFGLLRDTGRVAIRLATLYVARCDMIEAEDVITSAQRLLFTQGQMLLGIFIDPPIENDADDSGVRQSIAAWRETLQELTTVAQLVRSDNNPLGFEEDFLLLFSHKSGPSDPDDSYDLFAKHLDPSPSNTASPLWLASDAREDAETNYETYIGTEEKFIAELGDLSDTYKDRLEEIVGVAPDKQTYDAAKADPEGVAPWGELAHQIRNIRVAKLAIERNRTEINNLKRAVQIEVERRGRAKGVENAMSTLYIQFGDKKAEIAQWIGVVDGAQAFADGVAGGIGEAIGSGNVFLALGQVAVGSINGFLQASGNVTKGFLEGEKERLAARQDAELKSLESNLADIDSDAQINTMLLDMNVLAVDSQEAAILLTQEVASLKGLINEVERLETGLEEAGAGLAGRYFADPIHRLRAEGDVRKALLSFEDAQRWLFFMARALEYKWNIIFDHEYPSGSGRQWSVSELFSLRNAEELKEIYLAMVSKDSKFSWTNEGDFMESISLREDILGFKDGETYEDPQNPGTMVDAKTAFRNYLKERTKPDPDNNDIPTLRLGFSTVRDWEDLNKGLFLESTYLDKIRKMLVGIKGQDASDDTYLAGKKITYGGTSYIRRQHVGELDPNRPDILKDEWTAYSTRYWVYDTIADDFRQQEAQTVNVFIMVEPFDDLTCYSYTNGEFKGLAERSVATTGWKLEIPIPTVAVLNLDKVDDIEMQFCHRWKDPRLQ